MLTLVYKSPSGQPEAFYVDATISETESTDADVTTNPVEVGVQTTDHVQPRPLDYKVDGLIVDHPFPSTPHYGPGPIGETGGAQTRYEMLKRLQAAGTRIQVRGEEVHDDMVIVSLSRTRDRSTKGGVKFVMTMRKIRVVNSETVAIAPTKIRKAQPKKEAGKQTPTKATESERRRSVYVKLIEASANAVESYKKTPIQ